MKLETDIHQVNKLLKRRSGDRFKLLYKFTTENISGYIKEFDFKNKNLLTVGSSGDQVINANMCGCNDATVIDLNMNSEIFFNLKKAALIVLDYEEFLKFFSVSDNAYKMSIDIYSKLRETLRYIDLESLLIWDYIYDNYSIKQINNLFHFHVGELSNIDKFNPYLITENNYNAEKENIKKLKVKFINADVLKTNKVFTLEKFDNINLSNIYCYAENKYKLKKFKNGVNDLVNRLNKDGKMLVAYLYGTSHGDMLTRFASDNIIEDARYINFTGVRGIYNNTFDIDTAVVYEKKI